MISSMALAISLPSSPSPSMLATRTSISAWPRVRPVFLTSDDEAVDRGRMLRLVHFLPTAEFVREPQLNDGVDDDRMAAGAEGGEQLVGLRRCVELAQLADDAQRLVGQTGPLDGFVIGLGGGDAFLGDSDDRVGRLLQMVFAWPRRRWSVHFGPSARTCCRRMRASRRRARRARRLAANFVVVSAMIGNSVLFHGLGQMFGRHYTGIG